MEADDLRAHFLDNHAIGLQISQVMESVPKAVAAGLTIPASSFFANSYDPVATASGTDLITQRN